MPCERPLNLFLVTVFVSGKVEAWGYKFRDTFTVMQLSNRNLCVSVQYSFQNLCLLSVIRNIQGGTYKLIFPAFAANFCAWHICEKMHNFSRHSPVLKSGLGYFKGGVTNNFLID